MSLLFTCQATGRLHLPPLPYLAPILAMIGVALVLFWLQKDLGPALLFSTVLLTMLYAASGRASGAPVAAATSGENNGETPVGRCERRG